MIRKVEVRMLRKPFGNRIAIALLLLFMGITFAFAQTESEWATQGYEHYTAGRYAESLAAYLSSIEAGADNATIYYNAACSAALVGQADQAFDLLYGAADAGWHDVEHLKAGRGRG